MSNVELVRLGQDGVQVVGILNEVNSEAAPWGGPPSAWGVHGRRAQSSIHRRRQNHWLEACDVLVGEYDGKVQSVGVDACPGKELSTLVSPPLVTVRAGNRVGENGGDEGEEEKNGTHCSGRRV